MTSTHQSYNFNNRRNSSTAPYSIPINKNQQNHQHQHNPHTGGPISASVPSLSREFVVRRISEGESGRLKEDIKCEACGKGYKHISSLAKHLWEHTPEWNVTKKLLISKHQQVQLLEAASILVSMNDLPTSKSSSRRNSVFSTIDEDKPLTNPIAPQKQNFPIFQSSNGPNFQTGDEVDPKSSSPFSPTNSFTTGTSNTPTPPIANIQNSNSTSFRNAYSSQNQDSSFSSTPTFSSFKNNRNNSISQYPPTFSPMKKEDQTSSQNTPTLQGGYLDVPSIKNTPNSGNNFNNKSNNNSHNYGPDSTYTENNSFKSPSFRNPPASTSFMTNPFPAHESNHLSRSFKKHESSDKIHRGNDEGVGSNENENESTFEDEEEDGVFGMEE